MSTNARTKIFESPVLRMEEEFREINNLWRHHYTVIMLGKLNALKSFSEMGIYKRKGSKKEGKHAFDQEKKEKTITITV